jgi:nucleotide-binding universal stress UspA family protein
MLWHSCRNNYKKMKKVLIALDYDKSAQKVAEEGFSFAKSMGAEVTLLYVITDPVYYSTLEYSPIMGFEGQMETGPLQFDTVEALRKVSLLFLDKSKQHLGDNAIQTIVREGDIADSILKAAKELHTDVIVLGSHSRRWLENIILGSVAEKVLQETDIPLFIIPIKKIK